MTPAGGQVEDWGAPHVATEGRAASEPVDPEVQALVDEAAKLGPWLRTLAHHATFSSARDQEAFAAEVVALGFVATQGPPPPTHVEAIGLPFEVTFTRQDVVAWLDYLVPDLMDLAVAHGGRYSGFDPEPLFGDVAEPAPLPPAPPPPEHAHDTSVAAWRADDSVVQDRAFLRPAAVVLSLLAPGAGQLYLGRPGEAAGVAGLLVALLAVGHGLLLGPAPHVGQVLIHGTWLVAPLAAVLAARGHAIESPTFRGFVLLVAMGMLDLGYLGASRAAETFVSRSLILSNDGMRPAIGRGDRVVVPGRWFAGGLSVGDVVVFADAPVAARVVGVSGDRIAFDERGRLLRGGVQAALPDDVSRCAPGRPAWREAAGDQTWVAWQPSGPTWFPVPELVVPPGEVVIAGDSRVGFAVAPMATVHGPVRLPGARGACSD